MVTNVKRFDGQIFFLKPKLTHPLYMGLGLDYDWKLLASNKVPISIMKVLALKKSIDGREW